MRKLRDSQSDSGAGTAPTTSKTSKGGKEKEDDKSSTELITEGVAKGMRQGRCVFDPTESAPPPAPSEGPAPPV